MNESERALFRDELIEANHALIALGELDPKEKTAALSYAIRDCMRAYLRLERFRNNAQLSAAESAAIQGLLERLRVLLRRLGEDI